MFDLTVFFVIQNRKLLNSLLRKRALIGKNSVNKVFIWIPTTATLIINLRLKVFCEVFSLFYCNIFTDLSKKLVMVGGGTEKNAK